MDIRLQRDALLTELALLQGIVERRTTIPILSHLLLDAKDGKLALAATDLDVSLSTWCSAEVSRPGAVAVQAKKFHEIVRALADAELVVKLDEGSNVTLQAGRSRFRIRGLEAENFPTLPRVEPFRPKSRASSSTARCSRSRPTASRWWPPTAIGWRSSRSPPAAATAAR
jgi:DNA polymerase III subunit beta